MGARRAGFGTVVDCVVLDRSNQGWRAQQADVSVDSIDDPRNVPGLERRA